MSEANRTMSETTPMPFLLAFSGRKQVGKDTATEIAAEVLRKSGKTVVITAFAEPLKEMCINILGLKRENVYGTDEQKNSLSHIQWDGFSHEIRMKYARRESMEQATTEPRSGPMTNREVLQVMGTDIFRAIYGDVWAEAPFNRSWDGIDVVILTDCRFPNEKIVTERHGGAIIRLERDTDLKDDHPSETALDGFEFEHKYVNDKTVDELAMYVTGTLIDLELV